MRAFIAMAAILGWIALAGCDSETSGPSTSDYEKARERVLAQKDRPTRKAPSAGGAQKPAPETGSADQGEPQRIEGTTVARGYVYDPRGKRDPFRSFVLDQVKEAAEKEAGPLEQFDVSQLSVVAVVWDTGKPHALISDPSGRPYIVSEGMAVGKNEGRITRIEDNRVVIKETYVDWLGERTTKDIEMRLHREGKGGEGR